MNYTKYCFTIVLVCLGVFSAMAQKAPISISGKIVESKSDLPIEFATVLIADATTKKQITGTTSNPEGRFKFTTAATNFYIEISFIGFKKQTITDFKIENNRLHLGKITLEEDATMLENIVVEGEKSQTVFKLDKRVFNVGKDLSTTGASALEVLNNVPSVNVSIEGQISLRGSEGVQILINGKPSVLAEEGGALGTITADMIEKIEVITNPSAKYDAEGTSGIINIILKKSEKKGLNGSVTLNTGVPNNHSIGLSLNRRTEKFNLFSQIGYGTRTYPNDSEATSIDRIRNTTLNKIGESEKNENFFNLILGADYHINDLNVLTLSGNYAFESENENSNQNYTFLTGENLTDAWTRDEKTTASNPKWQYELQYKKDFKDNKEHTLLFSALGRSFSKDKNSDFINTTSLGEIPNGIQRIGTDFKQAEYTFKVDYTHPFSKKVTLETGAQYVLNDLSNDYSVDNFIENAWVNDANFSNIFDYNQGVLGVYSTMSYEGKKWGVKAGLRLEDTDLKTELINNGQKNNQKYTNLFPSLHSSYKVTDNFSLQAGYSKRVFRPRLWHLNPFFSFRDNFNLYTGNPSLNPEFTDSFELTSIYHLGDISFNFGVYHRTTVDVIERITLFSENVSTSIPQNVGTNNATGLELNIKYNPVKWFTFMADANFSSFKREGIFEQTSFNFTGEQWSTKVTGKFKLPANFALEVRGDYRSEVKTVQQVIADNLFMNLGIRKKMLKGRLNANLSVRDVFAARRRKSVADQASFYRASNSQRGRFITFGLSFGFGKGEAMEFSSKRHR